MRKDVFVREFGKFLSENLSDMEIEQIIYQSNEQGEFAYICYLNKSQKRIDITADSNLAIMRDILNNIESASYILPSQSIKEG